MIYISLKDKSIFLILFLNKLDPVTLSEVLSTKTSQLKPICDNWKIKSVTNMQINRQLRD